MTDFAALYRAASAAHPKVAVSPLDLERAWAARGVVDPQRAADVLVAVGIERGDGAALEWLRAQVAVAAQALARRVPQHLLADVESRSLELIAVGESARIRGYAARGPLAGWLQVVVAREGHAMAGARAEQSTDEIERAVLEELEHPAAPMELEALRSRFRGVLGPAMRAAGQRLDGKSRALISMHYVEGVSIDDIARAYQVHRATVSRWLAQARDGFLEGMRDELSNRANMPRLEVDSLVRVLRSQVDISLRRVVGGE